jgi:hypothetical protein
VSPVTPPSDPVSEADKHRLKEHRWRKFSEATGWPCILGAVVEFGRGESPEARFVHQIDQFGNGFAGEVYGHRDCWHGRIHLSAHHNLWISSWLRFYKNV